MIDICYITIHRWRCSQLWRISPVHHTDEAYQVSFRLIKVWPRLQPPIQFWVNFGIHNIITFEQKSIQKISLASSIQLSPKIIWDNFGKNWTDFQGGVAKRLLSIYFNTADRRCFGKWQMRHFQNQHNPGNKMTSKVQIWDKILKVKHFFKDRNISRTVGGAVFILLWYVQDMMLMIPTDFCDDMSNGSEDMKMCDKFQNGRQGVQSILA